MISSCSRSGELEPAYERSLIAERMRRGRRQKYQAGCLLPWTRPPTAIALIQHDHERWQACGSTQQKPRW